MFNTCRIPQLHCDSLSPQPPPHAPNSRKILVMVNDWTYAIEAYDENRQLLSVDTIEQYLRSVVQDVTRRVQAGEDAVPVGILSADHRDRWTEVRFVSFSHWDLCDELILSRTSIISSPSPLQTRRPLKSSNSRSSPSVLILTPSGFTHTPHAPHQPSTRLRKSITIFTTFVPRSMPGTGGSIRVTPSSSRPTPARGRWVNTRLATPSCPASLPIMPSHSPSFPNRSRRRNLLHSLGVTLMWRGGRGWTGSRMPASRRNVSPPNLAQNAS